MIDPFAVLAVHRTASKSEILQGVAQALRQRRFAARTVAEAQKMLFSPLDRAEAEFIYCFSAPDAETGWPEPLPHAAKPAWTLLEPRNEKGLSAP